MVATELIIPAVFWVVSELMGIFSRPAWWEWSLVLVTTMGLPVVFVSMLFLDPRSNAYFDRKNA
jgi:hypothetical protein